MPARAKGSSLQFHAAMGKNSSMAAVVCNWQWEQGARAAETQPHLTQCGQCEVTSVYRAQSKPLKLSSVQEIGAPPKIDRHELSRGHGDRSPKHERAILSASRRFARGQLGIEVDVEAGMLRRKRSCSTTAVASGTARGQALMTLAACMDCIGKHLIWEPAGGQREVGMIEYSRRGIIRWEGSYTGHSGAGNKAEPFGIGH
jgi:hypothetical protein